MNASKTMICCLYLSALIGPPGLAADGTGQAEPTSQGRAERMGGLSGAPVNSAISGGAILPRGLLLSALSFSYRDKSTIVDDSGQGARRTQNRTYLLKLRYSPADRLEIAFIPGYLDIHRDAHGPAAADRIQGPTDFGLGGTYALLSQRLGDPMSASVCLSGGLPTGQEGPSYPPGGDVWSYGAKIGVTRVWHPRHKVDWDLGFVQPTQTGNQGVRKGTVYTMTGSYHYVLNANFDVGVESTLEKGQAWKRSGTDMRNEYTELYGGAVANLAMPGWGVWVGTGLFFPVTRKYDIPTASDDVRLEVKIGKLWGP